VGREIRLNLVLVLALVLLPLAGAGSEEGMRVVPAQEILDKIEKGLPVEYDHVIIRGDLDLRKLNLPKRRVERASDEIKWVIFSESATIYPYLMVPVFRLSYFAPSLVSFSIRLNDSILNGNVYFNNIIFYDSVNFRSSDFKGTADFMDSQFNGSAVFGGSQFNGSAVFVDSQFNGYANFADSQFNGAADFADSQFNGAADFGGSQFNDYAYFWDAEFNDTANFGGAEFNDNAYFWHAEFNGYAYFRDAEFKRKADLGGSKFNDTAGFWNSTFNNSDFSNAQFSKSVSFDDSTFNNSTSFNSSQFKDDALFEGAVFDGTLYLTRAKYDRLYIRWKNIKELGYDDAAYLALQENFKKLGYLEDYDGCYYEYRKAHRDQNWSGKYHAMMGPLEERIRKRILDVALDDFYGYGKKPIRPLLWSIRIILFFGLFWLWAGPKIDNGKNDRGIFEKYGHQDAARKRSRRSEPRALLDALIFSATLFLSGTRLFVDPPQMPQMSRLSPLQVRAAFIAERVLGAFFSILFFLAISGTVVR
jgi:hypothetical protein